MILDTDLAKRVQCMMCFRKDFFEGATSVDVPKLRPQVSLIANEFHRNSVGQEVGPEQH